ncbi:MAG TPA: ABC transporter ATP-binding protein [Hellea balneolensis]|uniref:ABC transporter ATP-binding protein n=1 Tax=Hellea balneolensis TaxID=287478 RepID=A0A7C3GCW9_9PROT|nr:ABC transporter ATP-binding protein [Hellea balneolensis]
MLNISNISKSFGNIHALKNVSLELGPGMFGLLGPNGAGKSTLMRTLATLQLPDEGTITYNDEDIAKNPNAMRSILGYLPQDFGVYPRMSALALLDHMAVLKGVSNKTERRDQIEMLLRAVNLWTMRGASVASYSGGMKQRFGVAQSLLGDPKVLIVDEPTAGLDPFERQRFLDLLSEAGEDKTIILSTHIVDDVRDLCADMAILGAGEIVARGAPEDLIAKIEKNVWRKQVDKSEVEDIKENNKLLSTRLLRGGTIVSLLSDGSPGKGFKQSEPDLEDAYFAHLYRFV